MPLLMLKDLPRYECLLEAAREFPDLDPSATEVFLNLLRTGDEAFRAVEAHLAQHDITQGRFGVLMALWACDGAAECGATLSPAVLAERTGVTRATITGLVDTLERDGLVSRSPDPEDRRMLSVGLTARGEKLLRKILPSHFRQMAWLMQPLSESERKTLVRLLTKVLQRAAEVPPTAASSAPVLSSAR
ncbi:MarR family winged helix-turn-helix transcriptional regulator [Horticoccus sp. 23ND18S-11]|uniref:MarR family winged helix-turn-helix transcriptional regulator n=1 Tax=Horticoccus sp. 23ND18S-11 TaxID=3391832 RepID=UPI0039C9964B